MAKKRREWPVGLVVSVAAHALLIVVLVTVKVVQYIIEPPAEFKAAPPQNYTVAPKQEIKKNIEQRQRSGGGGQPPKVSIAVDRPSSFMVPKVDISVSTLNGKLSSRGSGQGIGDGNGDGQGPGSGSGQGGGRGFGRGSGLFNLTKFGASDGPGLTGYFYDLKQTRGGKPSDILSGGNVNAQYMNVLKDFTKNWDSKVLEKYYRGKKPLFATQIYVTNGPSDDAAKAFGEEKHCSGYQWVVHYKGSASAPEDGTFRFIGRGDNVMVVRLNEKIVFDGGFDIPTFTVAAEVNTSNNVGPGGPRGWTLAAGAWFKVARGDVLNLEVLIGDGGGLFSDYLLIEEKGKKYAERKDAPGFLAYPIFQLAPTAIPKEVGENGNPQPAKEQLVFPSRD